jgi:threonylcarbamoyladenosine tRNA methylthiotransferase MtaB
MKSFSINTLGCKVNQYETQQIRELLERLGLTGVDISDNPELVIINTCCVTHTASAKSRQYIHRAQHLNPDAAIVICGCLPTIQTNELDNLNDNLYLISLRDTLAPALNRIISGKTACSDYQNSVIKAENHPKIKHKNKLANHPVFTALTSFQGHTRAFLKIQDGCDGFCSYCIVPKARPIVQSRPVDEILDEAQALVNAGHKEIVLSGIFIGAFGQTTVRRKNWPNQQNNNLAELLEKLADLPNLARIRLSSLEPADVTEKLLDVFCRHPNIMPHLHLSLQSGSNQILKRMCRQYSADEFREKVELIKSRLDRPALTADIIVGFPGETDSDFMQTVELAKQTAFSKIHVFSFSPRKGTAAAKMQDSVKKEIIKSRSEIMRQLDKDLGFNFRQQFIGETATVLTENANGEVCGRSERYFMVRLKGTAEDIKSNELVRVKLTENTKTAIFGQPV